MSVQWQSLYKRSPTSNDPEPQMNPDVDRKWSRRKGTNGMEFGLPDFFKFLYLFPYSFICFHQQYKLYEIIRFFSWFVSPWFCLRETQNNSVLQIRSQICNLSLFCRQTIWYSLKESLLPDGNPASNEISSPGNLLWEPLETQLILLP